MGWGTGARLGVETAGWLYRECILAMGWLSH